MLDRLSPRPNARRQRRRKGRGASSGRGGTSGRGQKGAGARSGHKKRPWYEGGQMPLARRLPKIGFTNTFRLPRQIVNLGDLSRFGEGALLDVATLADAGLVPRADRPVKVLARGELAAPLTLRVDAISASARRKVEAVGGSVEIVARRQKGARAP